MTRSDTLLLHVCCGPCLAWARATLETGMEGKWEAVAGVFFYNPNIHPLLEFRRRVKALSLYLEREPVSAEIDDTYGLQEYLDRVAPAGDAPGSRRERCYRCYLLRLGKTAEKARAAGLGAFSSTLLASREQDRDLVAEAGKEAARRAGTEFVRLDLRKVQPSDRVLRGIYKQQYCGCIFSEEERYRGTTKHVYVPGGKRPAT